MTTLYDSTGAVVRVWDTSGRLVFGTPVDPPDPPDPVTPPEGPMLNVARRCAATAFGVKPSSSDGAFASTSHPVTVDVRNPTLEWVVSSGFTAIDTGGIFRASVQVEDGPRRMVTFDGQTSVRIEKPAFAPTTVTSDPVQVEAYAGETMHVISWIDADTSGFAVADLTSVHGFDRGISAGPWQTSPTLTPYSSAARAWSMRPSRIIGPSDQPAWVVVGDSIMQQDWSWGEQGVDAIEEASVKSAMGGDAYVYYPDRWPTRMGAHLTHATHVMDEFGINDIAAEYLTIATRALRFWKQGRQAGVTDYIKSTLTLAVGSSDNWATLEGQTPSANEARRAAFNTWLRDGAPLSLDGTAPVATGAADAIRCTVVSSAGVVTTRTQGHPVTAVSDVVAAIESSPNSGRYGIGAPSQAMQGHSDGLHPAPGIHALLAARLTRDLRLLGY